MSESESARHNTSDTNEECYSERNSIGQSEKKSINTPPNSLSKINKLPVGNANKVITGKINITSIGNKFGQFIFGQYVLKYKDAFVVTEAKLNETYLNLSF